MGPHSQLPHRAFSSLWVPPPPLCKWDMLPNHTSTVLFSYNTCIVSTNWWMNEWMHMSEVQKRVFLTLLGERRSGFPKRNLDYIHSFQCGILELLCEVSIILLILSLIYVDTRWMNVLNIHVSDSLIYVVFCCIRSPHKRVGGDFFFPTCKKSVL